MDKVHTINNACLTVWDITIGGRDFTRVISETATIRIDRLPAHWCEPFNNRVRTHLKSCGDFRLDDLAERFEIQVRRMLGCPYS